MSSRITPEAERTIPPASPTTEELDVAIEIIHGLYRALLPFARAFERGKYGMGVSGRDWKVAFDAVKRLSDESRKKS